MAPTTMPEPFLVGRYYEVHHPRKGVWVMFVESFDDAFVYGTVIDPRESAIQLDAGKPVSATRNDNSFILVPEGEPAA